MLTLRNVGFLGAAVGSGFSQISLAFGHWNPSPHIAVYDWTSGVGYVSRYSNPTTAVGGNVNAVSFNSTNAALAQAGAFTARVSAYRWSSAGFGDKYAAPTSIPSGLGNDVQFSPTNASVVVASASSPFIAAYRWTDSSGFGTRYSNPSTGLPSTGQSVLFSRSGNYVLVGHSGSPYISAYNWSDADGFGTKWNNPQVIPGGAIFGADFSPDGSVIYMASTTAPQLTAYASSATGPEIVGGSFGTKYANPTPMPSGLRDVSVSGLGDAVVYANQSGPNLGAFRWDTKTTSWGTAYSAPVSVPSSNCYGADFSPTSQDVAFASEASPYAFAYPWTSSSGFGTRYSNPTSPPAFVALSASFSS